MTAGSVDLIRNDLLWPISTVLYTEHDDKIPGQGPGGGTRYILRWERAARPLLP